MKVQPVQYSPSFKSGYPTFGTGHCSMKYDPTWDIYLGYKDPEPGRKPDIGTWNGILNYYA